MKTKVAALIFTLIGVALALESTDKKVPQEQGRTLGPIINGLAGAALGLFGDQNSPEGFNAPTQNLFGNNFGNGIYGNGLSDYVNSISGNRYGNGLYNNRYPRYPNQQLLGYNRPQIPSNFNGNSDPLNGIANLLGLRLGKNLRSYFGR